MNFSFFTNYLIEEGFKRESMVEDFGELSVRGGIVDVFPLNSLEPLRIEFDGNIIESIRIFDINTQRSIKNIDTANIVPPIADSTGNFTFVYSGDYSTILDYFPEDAPIFFHQPILAQKALQEYLERWQKEESENSHSTTFPYLKYSLFRRGSY